MQQFSRYDQIFTLCSLGLLVPEIKICQLIDSVSEDLCIEFYTIGVKLLYIMRVFFTVEYIDVGDLWICQRVGSWETHYHILFGEKSFNLILAYQE